MTEERIIQQQMYINSFVVELFTPLSCFILQLQGPLSCANGGNGDIYVTTVNIVRSNKKATKTSRTLNNVLSLTPTYKSAKYTWDEFRLCQPLRATCKMSPDLLMTDTTRYGWDDEGGGGCSGLKSAFNLSRSNHRLQIGFRGLCRSLICSVLTSVHSECLIVRLLHLLY